MSRKARRRPSWKNNPVEPINWALHLRNAQQIKRVHLDPQLLGDLPVTNFEGIKHPAALKGILVRGLLNMPDGGKKYFNVLYGSHDEDALKNDVQFWSHAKDTLSAAMVNAS